MTGTRSARLTNVFVGEGRFDLCLRIGELIELQEKTDCGPFALATRLSSGNWLVEDISQTLRLALIGGGMSRKEAFELVERTVIPGYLSDYRDTAQEAILAAIVGVEDEPIEEEDDPGNALAPTSADLSNGARSTSSAELQE